MNISLGDDLPVMKKEKKEKKSSSSSSTNNPTQASVMTSNKEMSTIDLTSMMVNNSQLMNRSQRESMAELMRSKTRDPIQILSSCTAFSRREVKMIYRNFKQDCPDGLVTAEILREVYVRFYPFGNPSAYASQVFRTLDCNKSGAVTFKEFLTWLSTISRGNLRDKLTWIFNLYDINGDGYISKDELSTIIKSIYSLLGDRVQAIVQHRSKSGKENMDTEFDELINLRTDKFFLKFDHNNTGLISLEDFIDNCINDSSICSSLEHFHTVI